MMLRWRRWITGVRVLGNWVLALCGHARMSAEKKREFEKREAPGPRCSSGSGCRNACLVLLLWLLPRVVCC